MRTAATIAAMLGTLFGPLAGAQAPARVCTGTYAYHPTVHCPGAPGNLVFAKMSYRGAVTIEGTFHNPTAQNQGGVIAGKITFTDGPRFEYAYQGGGNCAAVGPPVASARIFPHTLGYHKIGWGPNRETGVEVRTRDGRSWNVSGHEFALDCTLN